MLAAAPTPPAQEPAYSLTETIMNEIGEHRPANPDSPFTILIDQTVLRGILNKYAGGEQEVINLNDSAMERIHEAAGNGRCKDFPPEYSGDDLISDICNWLRQPPAQEDEPFTWVTTDVNGRPTGFSFPHEGNPFTLTPLYTHPDTSELRKAAEEVLEAFRQNASRHPVTPALLNAIPSLSRVTESAKTNSAPDWIRNHESQ